MKITFIIDKFGFCTSLIISTLRNLWCENQTKCPHKIVKDSSLWKNTAIEVQH